MNAFQCVLKFNVRTANLFAFNGSMHLHEAIAKPYCSSTTINKFILSVLLKYFGLIQEIRKSKTKRMGWK